MDLEGFMAGLKRRNPDQPEFHQAVMEVAEKVIPFINRNRRYARARILERMTEPDRIITFRVCWEDDSGSVRVNRGYRIQFNNAIGPYKGGLRFDRSVSLSVLKFLGFEQIFKNSLTTLPIGGGKGGSDFNPKGKSDQEVMRFCQAFMSELFRHIGQFTDIPAGDIGVGAREIGYLFGQYKRLNNTFTSVLTGKGLAFGGSRIRKEATGYGCVYFARNMLRHAGTDIEGLRAVVSGAGNVAQYTAEKLLDVGAVVLTMSDRGGFVHMPDGLTREGLEHIVRIKSNRRGTLADFAAGRGLRWVEGKRPWIVPCDMAFPCATQNELRLADAENLLTNGCTVVSEGANMPSSYEATKLFEAADTLFGPAKAANAGGVAISAMEMTQNAMRLSWTREEVDDRLEWVMGEIHENCVRNGFDGSRVNYITGANIAGFTKVADAMLAYGMI